MMLVSACVGLAALFTLFTTIQPAMAVDKTSDPDLVAKLKSAATMLDRLDMLTDDQLLYNFSSNPKHSWSPGSVCNANAATFPILSTVGVTVSQLNLGPCAMLAPHFHRANNLVVAVSGTTSTYMYQENGARLVQQTLTPGMMTIFPQASVHSMYNMGMLPLLSVWHMLTCLIVAQAARITCSTRSSTTRMHRRSMLRRRSS
jgi:predicted metal-dependent enzyme (double-stranded beta helix superfamily)